jgi:type IV pilus assembly protein PilV
MNMNRLSHPPAHARSLGFSLMEVLVALLVLAIGLLGLASLQAQSLKYNHDAYIRSQGAILVSELLDKVRSSPDVVWDGVEPADDCSDVAASLAEGTPEMALCLWLQDLGDIMPGGTGGIAQNVADARMYDVTLQWLDREIDNQADCEAIGDIGAGGGVPVSRSWDGASCLVNQIWTVFP